MSNNKTMGHNNLLHKQPTCSNICTQCGQFVGRYLLLDHIFDGSTLGPEKLFISSINFKFYYYQKMQLDSWPRWRLLRLRSVHQFTLNFLIVLSAPSRDLMCTACCHIYKCEPTYALKAACVSMEAGEPRHSMCLTAATAVMDQSLSFIWSLSICILAAL